MKTYTLTPRTGTEQDKSLVIEGIKIETSDPGRQVKGGGGKMRKEKKSK